MNQLSIARTCGLVVACLLGASSKATAILFNEKVVDTYAYGDCKGLGDLNGDGKLEVIIGGTGGMAFYQYPTWKRTVTTSPHVAFATSLAVGDMNGNGGQDIIVTDGQDPKGSVGAVVSTPEPTTLVLLVLGGAVLFMRRRRRNRSRS